MPIDWKEFDKQHGLQQGTTAIKPQEKTVSKGKIDWDAFDKKIAEQGTSISSPAPATQPKQSIPELLGRTALSLGSPIQQLTKDPAMLVRTIPETLGGKSPKEKIVEKFGTKPEGERWTPAFLRSLAAQTAGDIGNIATSPLSYIMPSATNLALMSKPVQVALRKFLPNLATKGGLMRPLNAGEEAYQAWLKNPIVSPTAQEVISGQSSNPIQKITQVLREAKPIRGEQEVLYTAERAKRAGQIVEAGQTVPGEQGYFAQLKALKGQLPKVQFEGIRGKLSQGDIDSLFNIVEKNSLLSPYEKITTKTGLAKLMGAEGGLVPTEGEIKLLSQVFPQDFIGEVLSKRPLMQKVFEGAEEVLNVPRSIMASVDMSAPLRQGIFLIGRPKQWLPAFRDMFKYAFNEKAYDGLMSDLAKRPSYVAMKESGLSLTNIGKSLVGREERFMSNLAEKIPVLGHLVRGSNRAYTGFLNKLRADVFDDLVSSAQKQGVKIEEKLLNNISGFVNAATGRGKLPGALEKSAVALNSVFFSPRLMASRLQLMNPVYYARLDPFVRKEALKSLFAFTGTATTIISLAKMGGANVGSDPRSADFGKIKVGNTRYDILGGFQQYIRFASQMITGEHISSTTGVKTTVGEGYKPLTRTGILGRFLETKEAPVISFALNLLRGSDGFGRNLDIPQEVAQRFVPMVAQDIYDLAKEKGLEGVAMGTPAIFGVGVQTYSPTPTEVVYSTNSVIKHAKELLGQGNKEEAKKLLLRNKDLIRQGTILTPLQKELSKLEKAKEKVIKDIRITPEQKKQGVTYADEMIRKIGSRMLEKYKEIK